MHSYDDLIDGIAETTLALCTEGRRGAEERLQTGARTVDVKILQRVNLIKAVTAIGMFSLTEAMLQDRKRRVGGFTVALRCLDSAGKPELRQRFVDFKNAINALKHGRGESYDRLLKRGDSLPFKIKQPKDSFFKEGDVSEIATLVEVDDDFVRGAAAVVREVFAIVKGPR